MDTDELKYSLLVFFKVLMENRSLTQSAEELDLSQAKASRNLARLRVIFQDPLFVRTRQGMVPTAKAQEVFPAIINLIYDLESLSFPLGKKIEDSQGTIKIAAIDNGVVMFISSMVDQIFERAPNLKLEITPLSVDIYEKIESGSIDMAIYPRAPLPADFHEVMLYEDHFVCIVHKEHPLAEYAKKGEAPPVEELNRYKRIEAVVRGNQNRIIFEEVYPNLTQKTQISSPYFFTMPYLLESKTRTVILPYTTAKALAQNFPIVILPAPQPYKTYKARLIWHHRTHHNPTLKWIRQLIIEGAKNSPFIRN